jgi:predicted MFS family arabinose efflux permease
VALVFSELRIMALSIVLLGVGIILTGQSTTMPFLLFATLVMSCGFHYFGPSSNGVILMSVDRDRTPKVLGELKSLGAIAALAATGTVYLLAERIGYRNLFLAVGTLVALAGLLLFPLCKGQHGLPARRKVKLRREYWLYYTLAFLMGSRRHILTTFAIFLLVSKFKITVNTTAILFFVNSLVNIYAYQLTGKLIARLGERTMLTIGFSMLIPIFLGYAYINTLPILFFLFVLDNILFGLDMALVTYFQKIAVSPEELTSNLSIQTTINHISAVVVPVLGGTVWVLFGYRAPFLAGVAIVVVSLILTQLIQTPNTKESISAEI